MKILVGGDPELFLRKDGVFVSGYGIIPGTKEAPHPVACGAVQVDGMAAEINIEPASDVSMFVLHIQTVLAILRGMVPEYEVVVAPVAYFTAEYMRGQPKEALELGCSPDFNAWTERINDKPDVNVLFRTAAGHIHVGWSQGEDVTDGMYKANCYAVARQLDFYLGLPSLLFDDDKERRELYGRAGACRPKSYGVEYRVLSNMWLQSEELIRWVYNSTQLAMEGLIKGNRLSDKHGDIQDIINGSQVEAAVRIMDMEEIPYVV